jgi:glutamate dehydrogenase
MSSRLIRKVTDAGRHLRLPARLPLNRSRFLERYYAHTPDEDLGGDARSLATAALHHMLWAGTRKPGSALVRACNPDTLPDAWASTRTVVQIVNDDMPFLVDSVTMRLNALGHAIHLTIHPVMHVARDRHGRLTGWRAKPAANHITESLIHIEIARETDPDMLARIERELQETLVDVRCAVDDWPQMLEHLREASRELLSGAAPDDASIAESCAFLDWLADDHFTLLGYREQDLITGRSEDRLVPRPGTGLGILRESVRKPETIVLTGAARQEARSTSRMVVTKVAMRSTVHRPARLDYIGIKVPDRKGRPAVEKRFLGLFTSEAYHQRPRNVPLIRRKAEQVFARSGFSEGGHRARRLQHVLDTFPRDDLFQISIDDLIRISFGILSLQERHRVRVFWRRDPFGRFYSCLVYLPRDLYNAQARSRTEAILKDAFNGIEVETDVTLSESTLARLAITVRTAPGTPDADPDQVVLQKRIGEAVRSWAERVRETLLQRLPEDPALRLLHQYADVFPASYQEEAGAGRAAPDIMLLATMSERQTSLATRLMPHSDESEGPWCFTVLRRDTAIPLHQALPVLQNMGMRVLGERTYELRAAAADVRIQDFILEPAVPMLLDDAATERFNTCFVRVLGGDTDSDRFNSFVLSAGLHWREAALLRAYCRFLLQTGLPFSQAYMQEVLGRHPVFTRTLVQRFHAHLDPDISTTRRRHRLTATTERLREELNAVTSLDEDRILRAFQAVMEATMRTNYFQRMSNSNRSPGADATGNADSADGGADLQPDTGKSYLSFKFSSRKIPDLPRPWPMHEIFVYSQRVEGVHLRCDRVARGGIRWSDRREDFRTEVLGLMKAQQVKNVVIVPRGAKGGFVCKRLPSGDRAAVQHEVTACYETFIRGLLDLTDNIIDGRIVRPPRVVARDDDDSYLVVAADKGTATFSDRANRIAAEYDFWLGDAFASGGSTGYDHKKMGITARGAWEATKRHFRELGVDVSRDAFTVIGIGDMSGDVFGNGMLLSPTLRLIAAFNHQHIFIDPTPDAEQSFLERQRLAALDRSGWDDYDTAKLSPGGGIYSRTSKSIKLSREAQQALEIAADTVTPPELIRAILRAPADLLWNGGIGTYVKASRESHADAGDPANDSVRVNGNEVRVRVVAEGGNLGFTQLGRIEYALEGGRINTDFIDNSGGVDSSDREVNLKILLSPALQDGRLTAARRNKVLANNYSQTQALSILEARARERLGEHARVIRLLESQGLLDRGVERLPGDDQIEERRTANLGLTRPELAVVLSYSKIQLTAGLIDSDIPEDRFVAAELLSYFPSRISRRFPDLLDRHPLGREIIAMRIASSMVNRMGPFFVLRVAEETGATVSQIARAYAIAREVFGVRGLWRDIESLDGQVQPATQYDAIFYTSRMLRRSVHWILQRHRDELTITTMVRRFAPAVTELQDALPELTTGRTRRQISRSEEELLHEGLPPALARKVASLSVMNQLLDIAEVARERKLPARTVAEIHFELTRGLKLDWLREQIEHLKVDGRWSAIARGALRETLAREQRAVLSGILAGRGRSAPRAALAEWLSASRDRIVRLRRQFDEMRAAGPLGFAALSVALRELGTLR